MMNTVFLMKQSLEGKSYTKEEEDEPNTTDGIVCKD